MFLKFRKFQPRYSYEISSYKKKRVCSSIWDFDVDDVIREENGYDFVACDKLTTGLQNVNQTDNLHMTVMYVTKNVVGF